MAITLNGITGLRVGVRASKAGVTGRAWIRRANLYVAGNVRVEFPPSVSIYTATQDVAKAAVPFKGTESEWWGENVSYPDFAYTQAVFNNPNYKADGVISADMVWESDGTSSEYVMDVQIDGRWTRIWRFVGVKGVNNAPRTETLSTFEPTAAFKFRHRGTELAGTFQGFVRDASGLDEPLTSMTTPNNEIVVMEKMVGKTLYGTFVPKDPALFPKTIGPIKIVE